jgi:uncharacterized protein involved in outer membrane biogenesis
MKKVLSWLLIVVVVLIVVAALAVHFFLDTAVKHGIETFGPKITKVDVKLQSVTISFISGSGKIKGLVVGNPTGFKAPSAIQVGTATLALQPGTLLNDKIVIKSINVEAPEITFETDLKSNNLKKLLANVQESTGGGEAKEKEPAQPAQPNEKKNEPAKPAKKLEVDDFVIKNAKLHVNVTPLNQTATVGLPEIHLTNLGTGPDGITPAELTKQVIQAIETTAASQAGSVVTDLGKGAQFFGNNVKSNVLDKATKGLGDLFKKKN